ADALRDLAPQLVARAIDQEQGAAVRFHHAGRRLDDQLQQAIEVALGDQRLGRIEDAAELPHPLFKTVHGRTLPSARTHSGGSHRRLRAYFCVGSLIDPATRRASFAPLRISPAGRTNGRGWPLPRNARRAVCTRRWVPRRAEIGRTASPRAHRWRGRRGTAW